MKYNITYKYYEIILNKLVIKVASSYDNTIGKGSFLASSNVLFKDKQGDLGYAAGVGKNEELALDMCLKEIDHYLHTKKYGNIFESFPPFEISDIKEISMAGSASIILNKKKSAFCYFKKQDDKLIILTDREVLKVTYENSFIDTLIKNIKLIKKSNAKNFTPEYLKNNGFEEFHTGKTLDELYLSNKTKIR